MCKRIFVFLILLVFLKEKQKFTIIFLMKLSDIKIVILRTSSEIIGYILIASSPIFTFYPFFIVEMFVFGFGDSIFGPSFNWMLSKSGDSREQGRIQRGNQALQSLARIIGSIIGGQIYVSLGHSDSAPTFMGVILIELAITGLFIFTKKSYNLT